MMQQRLAYFRQPYDRARLHAVNFFQMKTLITKGAGRSIIVWLYILIFLPDKIYFLIFT